MTATELGDWYTYFGVTSFTHQLIDPEFAALSNTVVSLVAGSKDISFNDFLLLKHSEETADTDDSLLMTAGEGSAGEYVMSQQIADLVNNLSDDSISFTEQVGHVERQLQQAA